MTAQILSCIGVRVAVRAASFQTGRTRWETRRLGECWPPTDCRFLLARSEVGR